MYKKLFLLSLCASVLLNAKALSPEALAYQNDGSITVTESDAFSTFLKNNGLKLLAIGVTAVVGHQILQQPSFDVTKNPLHEALPKVIGTVAITYGALFTLFISMVRDLDNQALYEAAYADKLAHIERELAGQEEPEILYLSDKEHEESYVRDLYPDGRPC